MRIFLARSLDRVRRGLDDLFGLFVVPACLALIPWRVAYPFMRVLARSAPSFRAEANVAWIHARRHVGEGEELPWKLEYRLIRWIERTDTFLTLLHRTAWWCRQVDVVGSWPTSGQPCLFLTFHWGAGNWVWRLLQARGFDAYFVVRRPQVADMGFSRVALAYGRLRTWAFSRIGSRGPLFTGGSADRVKDVFDHRGCVVGMLDLPALQSTRTASIALLGERAVLPRGLVDVAIAGSVPIAIFSCGFDVASGRRALRVEVVDGDRDSQSTMDRYGAHLDERLREASAYWMMWHESTGIFLRDTARLTARDENAGAS